jgi:hypothetical protein
LAYSPAFIGSYFAGRSADTQLAIAYPITLIFVFSGKGGAHLDIGILIAQKKIGVK